MARTFGKFLGNLHKEKQSLARQGEGHHPVILEQSTLSPPPSNSSLFYLHVLFDSPSNFLKQKKKSICSLQSSKLTCTNLHSLSLSSRSRSSESLNVPWTNSSSGFQIKRTQRASHWSTKNHRELESLLTEALSVCS